MRLEDKWLKNLFIWRSRFIRVRKIFELATITKCIETWLDIFYSNFKYDTNCMFDQAELHGAVVERSSGMLEGPGSILTWSKLYISFFHLLRSCYSFSHKQNCNNCLLNNLWNLMYIVLKLDKSKRHIWWVLCTENHCCLSLNTCVTDRVVFKHRQVRRKLKMREKGKYNMVRF